MNQFSVCNKIHYKLFLNLFTYINVSFFYCCPFFLWKKLLMDEDNRDGWSQIVQENKMLEYLDYV